mgnify:CR=1 FL=1
MLFVRAMKYVQIHKITTPRAALRDMIAIVRNILSCGVARPICCAVDPQRGVALKSSDVKLKVKLQTKIQQNGPRYVDQLSW